MAKKPTVSFRRNRPAWGFDRLRSDALTQLLHDLESAQDEGIPDEVCKKVKTMLSAVVSLSTEFPDKSFFRSSVFDVLQNFEEQYHQWNEIDGSSKSSQDLRRETLRSLRKTRHNLSAVVRKNQHIIEENLDLSLIDSVYKSIGDAVNAGPTVLINLSEAAKRYSERRIT